MEARASEGTEQPMRKGGGSDPNKPPCGLEDKALRRSGGWLRLDWLGAYWAGTLCDGQQYGNMQCDTEPGCCCWWCW